MAKLSGTERLKLSALVRELGEAEAAKRLKVGRTILARGLAGLDIATEAGGRIVRALWELDQGAAK